MAGPDNQLGLDDLIYSAPPTGASDGQSDAIAFLPSSFFSFYFFNCRLALKDKTKRRRGGASITSGSVLVRSINFHFRVIWAQVGIGNGCNSNSEFTCEIKSIGTFGPLLECVTFSWDRLAFSSAAYSEQNGVRILIGWRSFLIQSGTVFGVEPHDSGRWLWWNSPSFSRLREATDIDCFIFKKQLYDPRAWFSILIFFWQRCRSTLSFVSRHRRISTSFERLAASLYSSFVGSSLRFTEFKPKRIFFYLDDDRMKRETHRILFSSTLPRTKRKSFRSSTYLKIERKKMRIKNDEHHVKVEFTASTWQEQHQLERDWL